MDYRTTSTVINGIAVPVASVETISYAAICAQDPVEIERLVNACSSLGFFYLDLRHESTVSYLIDVETFCSLFKVYFDQSDEAKMKDFREKEDRGYKHFKSLSTYEISRDELTTNTFIFPAMLSSYAPFLTTLTNTSHNIAQTLLLTLASSLSLPSLLTQNDETVPSDTGLKVSTFDAIVSRADMADNKHTDSGTLTVQFCNEWGTSLYYKESDTWRFVRPEEGCAVVNVADSLERDTAGRLKSRLHRVIPPTDNAPSTMYVNYFLRPRKTS